MEVCKFSDGKPIHATRLEGIATSGSIYKQISPIWLSLFAFTCEQMLSGSLIYPWTWMSSASWIRTAAHSGHVWHADFLHPVHVRYV